MPKRMPFGAKAGAPAGTPVNPSAAEVGKVHDDTGGSFQKQLNDLNTALTTGDDPGHDHTRIIFSAINGEAGAMAKGDVVYFSNGATNAAPTVKFAKADAVASNAMPACGILLDATLASGATGTFLAKGIIENTAWTKLTLGGIATGLVWVEITGTTGNTWTQTKPAASGNLQQCIGWAVNDAYSVGDTGFSKSMYVNFPPIWNLVP